MVETGESLFCIHKTANLYVNDSTIAPVNNPIKPESINPPRAPMKITSIGTGAPLPINKGLSTLSLNPQMRIITAQMVAGKGSFTE